MGLGLQIIFLQDVMEPLEAAEISVYDDWDPSSPDLNRCPCRKQMIEI